jgi:YVTN family beta-propeller protein
MGQPFGIKHTSENIKQHNTASELDTVVQETSHAGSLNSPIREKMKTYGSLLYTSIGVCLLLAACASPAPTEIPAPTSTQVSVPPQSPTEIPQQATNAPKEIGQIISSTVSTVFPEKIHVSRDSLWYWFEDCGCVIRFDPASRTEIASIKIGEGMAGPYGNPKDMAIDGNTIWVTDAGHSAVVRIDPATNQIAKQIVLEATNAAGKTEQIQPFGLALDGKTLWVSDFDKNYVVRIDSETKKVVAIIPNVRYPEGIAVNSNGVWVVEHRTDSIVRIDPASNKVIATISIQTPKNAAVNGKCGMCLDSVVATGDAVWVPLDRGNAVARIDPGTNQVSAMIPLEFSPRSLVIGDHAVWAAGGLPSPDCGSAPGGLASIKPKTNKLIGTVSIPCATSVGIYQDYIWVGSGYPGNSSITTVKPITDNK